MLKIKKIWGIHPLHPPGIYALEWQSRRRPSDFRDIKIFSLL